MVRRVASLESRSRLRSAASMSVLVPRTRSAIGGRAFAVAGPTLWNSLPGLVQSASSMAQFRKLLKTHLFQIAYYK